MVEVYGTMVATSLAPLADGSLLLLDCQGGLRVVTRGTQNVFPNETIQQVLQLAGVMRTIHNVAVVFEVKLRLGTQLTAKVLGWIWRKKQNYNLDFNLET